MSHNSSPKSNASDVVVEETVKPVRKRRRIAIACASCRHRKSRCNGARPTCSACEDLNIECVYAQGQPNLTVNTLVPKQYLESLEARLSDVEGSVRSLSTWRKEISNVDSSNRAISSNAQQREACEDLTETTINATLDDEDMSDVVSAQEPNTGVGSIGFTEEENTGYFGPSSNVALIKHISRAVISGLTLQQTESISTETGSVRESLRTSRPSLPLVRPSEKDKTWKNSQNMLLIPSDEETLRLVHQYFATTGALFPFIHERSFIRAYHDCRRVNFRKVRRSWLGLLNLMLAMSTSTDGDLHPVERVRQSEIFFNRAMRLCKDQILRGASLEIVHFLLLLSLYLQGTQQSIQTWDAHGLAVKAAFQLGLHSRDALKSFSHLEKSKRTRTWYTCVMLDRTLSMTFGRPSAIPENYVQLDLPLPYNDGASASGETNTDQQAENSLMFFNATTTLYKVMWSAIDSLYGCNIDWDDGASIFDLSSRTIPLEHQLSKWQTALPSAMSTITSTKLSSYRNSLPDTLRFRFILTLRYHNLRILVHRPLVVKLLDVVSLGNEISPDESDIIQRTIEHNLSICTQSATEIALLVRFVVTADKGLRELMGAWWFTLYYTFNAALVLFAALWILHGRRHIYQSNAHRNTDVLRDSLIKTVQSLDLLDRGNPMTEECARYASRLVDILDVLPDAHHIAPADATTSFFNKFIGNRTENASGRDILEDIELAAVDLSESLLPNNLDFLNDFDITGFY